MDAATLIKDFTTTTGELSLDLLELARDILAAGTAHGWHRPDDAAHLRAVRLIEQSGRATEHTRIRVVADADAAKAARSERTYLADIIAHETKDTPRRATNAVFAARNISRFPLVLDAFADAQIGRGHISHAVKALATVQPFFDDEPFEALTRDLLERAATTDPLSFKTDCERLVADVDELSKKSQEALAKIKRERSSADRAMIMTPRDRNHPEFGMDVAMHLTGADTSILTPVIDRIAESLRRRRLESGQDPKPLKERRIEALIELARRFGNPNRRSAPSHAPPSSPSPVSVRAGSSDDDADVRTPIPLVSEGTPTHHTATDTIADTTPDAPARASSPTHHTATHTTPEAPAPSTSIPTASPTDAANVRRSLARSRYGSTSPKNAFPDAFDDLFALQGNIEDAPDFVKEALADRAAKATSTADTVGGINSSINATSASPKVPTTADRARLAVGELREAIRERDGGCVFPGCDIPFERCIVHHLVPFSAGGTTTVNNLCALCETHHTQVENPPNSRNFATMRMSDDGTPELIPPVSRDPLQRPVRHARFRPAYGLSAKFKDAKRSRPKPILPWAFREMPTPSSTGPPDELQLPATSPRGP